MRYRHVIRFAVLLGCLATFGRNLHAQTPEAGDELLPGTETRIETPDTGGFFLLYLPDDYSPDRLWPVIFGYHGLGGSATTWPFRQATHGEGFLIAGMTYASEEYHRHLLRNDPKLLDGEKAHFEEALRILSRLARVDAKKVFMGGFSQGGYSTTLLGEAMLERLAGLIVLGAGRYWTNGHPPQRRPIWRKPIFVGVGEQDEMHRPRGQEAAAAYKRWGADVTLDEWPNTGHTFPRDAPALYDWLHQKAGYIETPFERAIILNQ
jgi:predicted esterase